MTRAVAPAGDLRGPPFPALSSRDLSGGSAVLTRGRARPNFGGMWRVVLTLMFAFALAGVVGQASAFAAPEPPARTGVVMAAMAAMPDCPEMAMPTNGEEPSAPCGDSGPDCMGVAACAAVAVPLPSGAGFADRSPAPRRLPVALKRDDTRAGEQPAPPANPPKTPA